VPKRQPLAENLAKARLLNLATWHLCLFGVFFTFQCFIHIIQLHMNLESSRALYCKGFTVAFVLYV